MSLLIDRNINDKNATNLAILNRHDPHTIDIVEDATHAAIYRFDATNSKWERLGVEGAFFITKRSVPPHHRLMVLNRLGPENFDLDISAITKIKSQPPYVMIRCSTSGAPAIFGIWFHDVTERDRMLGVINKLLSDIESSPVHNSIPPNKAITAAAAPPSKGATSVLALLSSAFKEKAKGIDEIDQSPPPPPISAPVTPLSRNIAPSTTLVVEPPAASEIVAPSSTVSGGALLMCPSDFTGVSAREALASKRAGSTSSAGRSASSTHSEIIAAVLSELSTDSQFIDSISRRLGAVS